MCQTAREPAIRSRMNRVGARCARATIAEPAIGINHTHTGRVCHKAPATIGFRDGLWLDTSGSQMSDAEKMTERIRRPTFGSLEIEITVDDPKTYTRPWTVSMPQAIALDRELVDEFCLENEKSSQSFAK